MLIQPEWYSSATLILRLKDKEIREDVKELIAAARGVIAQYPNTQKVVVDAGEAEVSSSSFLGFLLILNKDAKDRGGEFVLCGPSKNLQEQLRVTKLEKLFRVVSNKEETIVLENQDDDFLLDDSETPPFRDL